MKYTLEPTITEKRIIERRFPAWDAENEAWHPKIAEYRTDGQKTGQQIAYVMAHLGNGILVPVTKSSTLVHSGSPCKRCNGKGSPFPTRAICQDCHGSCIEGEGEWRVEE